MQQKNSTNNRIKLACFSPHPPLLLPAVGTEAQRKKVRPTITALITLRQEIERQKPDSIIISSPHPDWGFNVPLYFLAPDFKGEIKRYLTAAKAPRYYFQEGKQVFQGLDKSKAYVIIGSGDLSHSLKEDGPYGFHPQGPEFDKALIRHLKEKEVEKILELNEQFPQAGECGLRSFCFILGILEASALDWYADILSYQAGFGVGYLVVKFNFKN